uniref:Uncharacterized protein n=1 Tax=viral metagenome TaxID=1070528 RepID=A0A6C0EIV4_9ZZZZ
MKSIILILFIIGISLIIIGYYEHMQLNPVNKIEYRYISRNYLEDQMADQNLRNKYSDLFNRTGVWSGYPFDSNLQ